MVVMLLEKVPAAARGELSRWLMEVRTGVYIGHVNARVRDLLWEKCCNGQKAGHVFQAWSTNSEQHFQMRIFGYEAIQVINWEGLQLIQEVGEQVAKDLSKAKQRRIR